MSYFPRYGMPRTTIARRDWFSDWEGALREVASPEFDPTTSYRHSACTFLHHVVAFCAFNLGPGWYRVFRAAIEAGAAVNARDALGYTVLHYLADKATSLFVSSFDQCWNLLRWVTALVAAGASPSILAPKSDKYRNTETPDMVTPSQFLHCFPLNDHFVHPTIDVAAEFDHAVAMGLVQRAEAAARCEDAVTAYFVLQAAMRTDGVPPPPNVVVGALAALRLDGS